MTCTPPAPHFKVAEVMTAILSDRKWAFFSEDVCTPCWLVGGNFETRGTGCSLTQHLGHGRFSRKRRTQHRSLVVKNKLQRTISAPSQHEVATTSRRHGQTSVAASIHSRLCLLGSWALTKLENPSQGVQ